MKLGIYRHRTIGYWNSDWESLQDQTVYYDSIVSRKPKKKERIKKGSGEKMGNKNSVDIDAYNKAKNSKWKHF